MPDHNTRNIKDGVTAHNDGDRQEGKRQVEGLHLEQPHDACVLVWKVAGVHIQHHEHNRGCYEVQPKGWDCQGGEGEGDGAEEQHGDHVCRLEGECLCFEDVAVLQEPDHLEEELHTEGAQKQPGGWDTPHLRAKGKGGSTCRRKQGKTSRGCFSCAAMKAAARRAGGHTRKET